MNDSTSTQSARKKLVGTRTGTVISDKRDRTRTVQVNYQIRDSKYGKILRKRSMFHVHDPENTSKTGDVVQIAPCRPISKTKSWRLVKVIEAGPQEIQH